MNPGGSVKDRAALYLIKDALEKGQFVYYASVKLQQNKLCTLKCTGMYMYVCENCGKKYLFLGETFNK